jgi:autophagy-related protein 9
MSARERALWRWVNVDDLDRFLEEVYRYYLGKGVWTIGLERILNLLWVPSHSFLSVEMLFHWSDLMWDHRTVGWVIGFSTFLLGCIDYPKLWHADRLADAVVSKCVSRWVCSFLKSHLIPALLNRLFIRVAGCLDSVSSFSSSSSDSIFGE